MRVIETRNHLSCRLQIAEQSASGWTVLLYLHGKGECTVFRSERPDSLNQLIKLAEERAAELERADIPMR